MKVLCVGLLFVLIGCAGFSTRDNAFRKRYTGEIIHEFGNLYYQATYNDGLIDNKLIYGNKGCCKTTVSYVNGKRHGKQVYEAIDGRKVILFNDSTNTAISNDSSVDENGNRWVTHQVVKSNGNNFRKIEDRFHKIITISQMKDTTKNGPEFIILASGDTVCYEINANGKSTRRDTNCTRSTEDILSVIRKNIKGVKSIYDKHLKAKGFRAKINLMYSINPSGTIELIHVEKILTDNVEFVKDVVEEVSKWKFRNTISPYNDVVTVPLSFTPN